MGRSRLYSDEERKERRIVAARKSYEKRIERLGKEVRKHSSSDEERKERRKQSVLKYALKRKTRLIESGQMSVKHRKPYESAVMAFSTAKALKESASLIDSLDFRYTKSKEVIMNAKPHSVIGQWRRQHC